MDTSKNIVLDFVENNWKFFLTVVVSIIGAGFIATYYTGYYKNKIETLDKEIISHNGDIKDLVKSVHFILGKLDAKGINVRAYLNASSEKNLSFREIITGLSAIDNSKPMEGEKYLMQHKGFTKKQASSVFKKSK